MITQCVAAVDLCVPQSVIVIASDDSGEFRHAFTQNKLFLIKLILGSVTENHQESLFPIFKTQFISLIYG